MADFPLKAAKQLSLLCVSFTLLSLTAAEIGAPSKDAQFLKRMKEYWREGDFELAKRQIRSYLEENQGSDLKEEMHLLLGDLYLKDGNFSSALEEYDQIEKTDLQDKAFYNKVLCFYETGRTQELADISTSFTTHEGLSIEQKNSIRYLCASSLFEYLQAAEEKDSSISNQSKELFESCKGTSFENLSFYPLAKLYELEGNKNQAASYYEAASRFYPDQSIDFLFQAALLRADTSPELSIANFQRIISSDSPKNTSALYNCLLLQYKLKQFQEVVSTYEKNQSLIDSPFEATTSHLVGKSFYHLEEFEKAIPFLLSNLNSSLPLDSKRTAQLMILECAHKIQNVDLYHKMFRNPSYPLVQDENYTQAHLVYLDLLKSREKYPEFIEESKAFVIQNQDHPEKERVLWDLAYSLYQEKNWQEADLFLASFIQEFPTSASTPNGWRLSINCSLSLMQTSSPEMISARRDSLIEKIQKSLEQPHLFNSEETETFSFELAKNLFLSGRFEETLTVLPSITALNSNSRFIKDIDLITTLCHLSNPGSQNLFIRHAENLLQKHPELSEGDKIRLHLFNAYLEIANESSFEEKQDLLKRGADQLYCVFEKKKYPLQQENIEWLAEHYYTLSKKSQEDLLAPQHAKETYLTKATSLFDFLLSNQTPPLNENTEVQLLRFSELLSYTSQTEKKIALLSRFIEIESPSLSLIQKKLVLDLASAYEQIQDSPKALNIYQNLIQHYPYSSTKAQAVLNRSQLLFTYLSEDQKNEENTTFIQNLNDLKDLELQKSLSSEPLHLEAGLEYIKWKTSLVKESRLKQEKNLQLLRLFRENFAKEHEEQAITPFINEKKQILLSYLQFAEAEMLALEASLSDSSELLEKANVQLEELFHFTSLPLELKKWMEFYKQELK